MLKPIILTNTYEFTVKKILINQRNKHQFIHMSVFTVEFRIGFQNSTIRVNFQRTMVFIQQI